MATAAIEQPFHVPAFNQAISHQAHVVEARTTNNPQNHDIETTLQFFKPNEDGSPPHPTYVGRPETYERPRDTQKVLVKDVSGHEDEYSLDSHGFQFYRHIAKEKDFLDEEQIVTGYYKEVDKLLKAATGATRTFIFDHTIRRSPGSQVPPKKEQDNNGEDKVNIPLRGPVRSVHIDQSYSAALNRVTSHLPADAEHLLKGRVQLINVWRPIKTIKRDPLAVAQSQSVDEEDLVPIPLIYENRNGSTLGVKYNPKQKFFYKHHQTPEEVLLIKCFDNKAGVESEDKYRDRAKRVPHTAFEVPGTGDEETRESIEVRCLVFDENDVE